MLFQQNSDCANINKGQERSVKFIITREYSSKPFQLLKKTLNQMTLFVGIPIYVPRIDHVAFGRNRIGRILRINVVSYHLSAIGLVPKNIAPLNIDLAEQGDSMCCVMFIAGTQQKNQRIAQAIHQSMNLRIAAASGNAYRLIFCFFPRHLRFDAPCRKLSRWRYSQSPHLWKEPERLLQIRPVLSTCGSDYKLSAMHHISPEVLATVPLLWQSTVSHSLHCGYRILPGVRVSLSSDVLAVAYP